MMRRAGLLDTIFIHAGLPKTGSTFLQNGLGLLSQASLLQRTAYPELDAQADFLAGGSGNGAEMAGLLLRTGEPTYLRAQLRARLEALLERVGDRCGNLLISSELFFYAGVEEFRLFQALLSEYCRSVRMVLSVRPLREWTFSVYMHQVKAHGLAEAYDVDWLRNYCLSFEGYFANVARFDVPTTAFAYSGEGQLARFLEILGEPAELALQVPPLRVNRSLSLEELDLLRRLNGLFNDSSLSKRISDLFVRTWPDATTAAFPASAEADFRQFKAEFKSRLDRSEGGGMDKIRSLLFKSVARVEGSAADAAPELARERFELVLRAVHASFLANAEDVRAMRVISANAANLEPTRDFFDPIHYLLLNPDLLHDELDPWDHFLTSGRKENRWTALTRKGIK